MADIKLVNEWMRYANNDMDAAQFLYKNMHPVPFEIICFHYQQAAEKYIKAVILYNDGKIEKIHDLVALSKMLIDKVDISPITFASSYLTQFAVRARYPQDIQAGDDETKAAISEAKKVKSWARAAIGGKE